jgi:hypothetical protein
MMRPLLTGVEMAGFTHRPGFEIKNLPNFLFPTKFYPLFAFLPGVQSSKPCSARLQQQPDFTPVSAAAAPAFAGDFPLKIFFDHHCSSSPCML